MLPLVHTLVLATHVLFAAAWFGLGLAMPSLVRAIKTPEDAKGAKVMSAMNGSVVIFYLAAVANWVIGRRLGFEIQYNHWAYHVALTLGLILVIVQFVLIRRGWNTLAANAGTPAADAGRKQLKMGIGIGHAVWMALFILMYIGRGLVSG